MILLKHLCSAMPIFHASRAYCTRFLMAGGPSRAAKYGTRPPRSFAGSAEVC